jgi:CheY-like chemotaxis protein
MGQRLNHDELLGKKVAFYRSRMNWPLKTLAAELCVSIQQIQRYEKGVNKISASTLYELARIFKVDVTSFFSEFEGQPHINAYESFNVLLIEDNPNDEFLFRQALGDFPHALTIHGINDGHEALSFLKSLGTDVVHAIPIPDIIFLDLHLPSLRGLDILKTVKRHSFLQNIPIVILTSSVSSEDRIQAYNLQASGFIRKSFDYKEFKEQLYKAMIYWIDVVDLPRSNSRPLHGVKKGKPGYF